jgi:lipoate-protein ligase A
MQFLDLTLPTLPENLALDEALLLESDEGRMGELLRLWEWPSLAVVLGAGGRLVEEVDEICCRDEGVPIYRRSSGGGTVLLGKGCLLYSLVLAYERAPPLREIPSSNAYILGRIREALAPVAPEIEKAGISDLALNGRKFSGNAQQRKRHFLLHHGTILYRFEVEQIARYLRQPARQPEYRRDRPHAEFVANLPVAGEELKRQLREVWQAEQKLYRWPEEIAHRLVVEKYTNPEWIKRR